MGDSLPIYFLRLDLFDNSRVQLYMDRRRLPDYWFPEVSKHEALLEILYRPLLLRIFCDMASISKGEKVFERLKDYKNAAQLIEDYVRRQRRTTISNAHKATSRQTISGILTHWPVECLDLYLKGVHAMQVENIRRILRPDAENAEVDEVWRSIHKCPFLKRNDKEEVVFTHSSFLEFFVAKGVSLDMKEKQDQKFSAFDTLVLNVDTRKFLKSIMVAKEGLDNGSGVPAVPMVFLMPRNGIPCIRRIWRL